MERRLRAVGYVRVSKADKKKGREAERLSIEAQRLSIRKAAEYNGWDLIGIKVDDGKTGTNTRRDGYQEALVMLKDDAADMLVAARYDRLSRSTRDFIDLMETSVRQQWFLSVLDQRVDTSTAVGRLMARTMASHAEFERDLISERTKDALAVLKANGQELGRKSAITDDLKRKVKRWHRQGESASGIARRLTAQGVPTPTGRTNWHHSVIVDLLRREAVAS